MQRVLSIFMLVLALLLVFAPAPQAFAQADSNSPSAENSEGDTASEDEEEPEEESPATKKLASSGTWTSANVDQKRKSAYLNWLKFVPVVLLVLLWTATGDWVNRSTQIHGLGYGKWNPIIFFPFLLAMVVFVAVPNYPVGIGVLTLAYFGPFIAYTVYHNGTVESHQKVFTSDWFRYTASEWGSKVGIKINAERVADYDKGAPVDLDAIGGELDVAQGNLITARQSPGYLLVKDLVVDMVSRRSERMVLDYTQSGVGTKHLIDGVWHAGEPSDRESGDVMLAVMKQLANLDITERRKKQEGRFAAKYEEIQYLCPFTTQGTKTGERVLMELTGGSQAKLHTYDDLGMRDKIRNLWAEFMAADVGLLLIAAMPEGGLTTLTDISILETDRLMRDFIAIEDQHGRHRDIENVTVTTYDSQKEESPATHVAEISRTYPNVYIVRDFINPESAKMLLDEIDEDRLVITTVRAIDAPEALLRMLQKKVPHRDFANKISAVLCTRMIRLLCDECKVGYPASPDLLKKLGIPAGKVEMLYQAPKPGELEKPCEKCGNTGYIGRTGLFELLPVNDKVREVLIKKPKIDLLRKASRLAGMRTFQEEAILLVAKGTTSLQEAQRILKGQ